MNEPIKLLKLSTPDAKEMIQAFLSFLETYEEKEGDLVSIHLRVESAKLGPEDLEEIKRHLLK